MKKIEFFSSIKNVAFERQSLYDGSIKSREKLLDFLVTNDWFGQKVSDESNITFLARNKLYITEAQFKSLCESLYLWLDGFKQENRKKLEILMQYGEDILPETVSYYREFTREEKIENDISTWRLLDFLLYYMSKEISEYDEDIEKIIDILDQEATRAVSILYTKFHDWLQEKFGIGGWRYKFEYRKKRNDVGAYSISQFSGMAYCLFNEEYWQQQGLIEKACNSAHYANLWAFISMHFVCGLRSTDIVRLPMPDLGVSGKIFREKLLAGTIKTPEVIAQDMQIRIRYSPKQPNKTIASSAIPDIKIFIPVSMERPIGIILGIAASHYENKKPGEIFIRADRTLSRTRNFLGADFMKFLGDSKAFASLKANKAYLQGIDMMADKSECSAKGYMLAALARSHKGGLNTLPNITDIYLKDAKFFGYKPEFIAKEMFERGVFGFIPHLLLKVYSGKNYNELSISMQTNLIKSIGICPSGIENIIRMCETSLNKAREVVTDIVSSNINIASLMQEIASGTAIGKEEGCLCVMIAGGFTCAFPDRAACIGCRYEIHTKAILHKLASEYARMRKMSSQPYGWRYIAMIKKVILPIISEYLATAKNIIPNIEDDSMLEIMQGGLLDYVHSSK